MTAEFKIDGIFVKPARRTDPDDLAGGYLFAPLFGRTLKAMNQASKTASPTTTLSSRICRSLSRAPADTPQTVYPKRVRFCATHSRARRALVRRRQFIKAVARVAYPVRPARRLRAARLPCAAAEAP